MPTEDPAYPPFDVVLHIERTDENVFTARLESHGGRTFGGQLLGCAARAIAHTGDGYALHSVHASFLRPAPPEVPLTLRVERLSDGRRFARRRAQVRQEGRLLFECGASLAAPETGAEYQDLTIPPDTPQPEDLPTEEEVARAQGWTNYRPEPIEWRWIGAPWEPGPHVSSRYTAWVRPTVPLPEEPGLHAAATAFLSDYHSHWPTVRKLGTDFGTAGFVSLDQLVWLHRALPWDDWRLITSDSDIAHGGRAFGRRALLTRDGRLVATMAQETLIVDMPSGGAT